MARMTFKAGEEYALKLSKLLTNSDEIAKKALYEGAKIVGDKIKDNLNALPTEKFRYLRDGDVFNGLPEHQKSDLVESFGITPIKKDNSQNWTVKIGFDGYGKFKSLKFPKGLPNQLLARAVESGSSIRAKTPFVRPAVNATKKEAQTKMGQVIDEECEKIFNK